MVRVIFLIQHRDLPSGRYRVLQFLPYLEKEGIESCVEEIPKGIAARKRLFARLPEYDVVFLQKKNFYPWTMKKLRAKARALVYDIDDAVMLNDSSKGRSRSWKREWRFAATAGAADILLVVNNYVALLSSAHAKDIRVLPTVVDLKRYAAPDEPAGGLDRRITIGWIGSGSTLPYLEAIKPALEEAGRRYGNVQLKLICDRFFDLKNMPVVKARWSEETEIVDLFSLDIGLGPAVDDPWFRGKGVLKMVQYLAASKPVVCSPVGVQREIITDGETGLWARSPSEWVNQIGRLIEDPALRTRLGKAGRRRAEEKYSVSAVLPQFVKAIKDAAKR